ncbi:protein PLANT CADMIUM RESISTANCE 2-like [Humulus lupulus]|uniref:protein PLANT CADMIUM RESISTANCE 2-like n=1 Tax=Humulus lupulus TaxID=3486 RepID=UPI002B411DFE|nr:protein PLANT CADMIUM RESISTANCE 2-like [Humulus lupulus]
MSDYATARWSTGLFDCFSDCKSCCLTFWCPCVTFGRVAEIVDKGTTSCGTSGALYALAMFLTGWACLCSCCYRSKMREHYGLKGNSCKDCLIHSFCEGCALCQMYRELENRGYNMKLGWQGGVEEKNRGMGMGPVAPTVQGGMTR